MNRGLRYLAAVVLVFAALSVRGAAEETVSGWQFQCNSGCDGQLVYNYCYYYNYDIPNPSCDDGATMEGICASWAAPYSSWFIHDWCADWSGVTDGEFYCSWVTGPGECPFD